MSEEKWIVISKAPNYMVSSFGRIKNAEGKILNQWALSSGYKQIQLSPTRKKYLVHRIVAEYHVLNPENKPFVLHNDNDPANNNASNLRWGTQSENISQAHRQKRMFANQGVKHPLSKLSEEDVKSIRKRKQHGSRVCQLAREYNVCHQLISDICNRKVWNHI